MSEQNYEHVIGMNIKKERKAKGLSQTELGNRCQIAHTVISSYENGKKNPGLDSVVRIASGLGVSIDQLCYGDETESFINKAPNEGRKIVNCIYTLWEMDLIYYYEKKYEGCDYLLNDRKAEGVYLVIKKYDDPIKRLIKSLDEFNRKKETFSDPEIYLESILSSVSNEINKQIEEEKKREKEQNIERKTTKKS